MAITVTATATANGSNGMVLRVYALTGAAAVQNGASAVQSAAAAHNASITTTVTGSQVYGACLNGAAATPTVLSAATAVIDAVADAGHTKDYATCKAASVTGTPGATALGFTDSNNGGIALYEVLPAGTIAQDASSPAVVSTTAATTLTTASFTPPPGSVLIALVAANGASSVVETVSVSDSSGLTWTAQAQANASNMKYAGVWTAVVQAAAGTPLAAARRTASRAPAVPPSRRFRALTVPPQLDTPFPAAETRQWRQPRGMQPRRPHQFTVVPPQLNPPYPFTETAQHRETQPRGLPRRGRQANVVPPQVNPPFLFAELRQWRQPRGLWPRRGHGFAPVPAQQAAAPVPAWVPQLLRHARLLAAVRRRAPATIPAVQDVPLQAPRHARPVPGTGRRRPVQFPPRQDEPPRQRAAPRQRVFQSRRGRVTQMPQAQAAAPAPAWVQGHRAPPRAAPLLIRRGRVTQAPGQPPAPPPWAQSHRGPMRAIAFIRRRFGQLLPWPQAVQPPFSVGTLTADGAAAANLTAAGASSALTAATAAGSTLTAGDQRTGGPS